MSLKRGIMDAGFIVLDDKVMGINLGWDAATEHETGIRELRKSFGIGLDEKLLGYEARKNTAVPKTLFYHEDETASLVFVPYSSISSIEEALGYIPKLYDGEDLATGWESDAFAVRTTLEHGAALKNVYEAFRKKSGIIMLGNRTTPFANPGLILMDYRKIPEEYLEKAREIDRTHREEQANYRRLEKESGVFELLEKGGKEYFALSIRGLGENGKPRWWLYPEQQDRYEAGWYSTEDLKLWAKNKGPVMREADSR
ncbi:TPA: hypothetical protein HA239_03170 [Candidatus Woesearchaeota archaeon]|nr:hypothetical protein QT06_C0001G0082 [archaeon GW2011_AR15]MBS3104111.1 hypothetical protein [Candidatus Woesearchaeota archaeon]HIH41391.1 hypothetical protein [Candidatus Woesearchaeota archaeon]